MQSNKYTRKILEDELTGCIVVKWSKCCDTVLVRAGQFLTKRFLSFVPMDFRLSLLEVALADRLPVSL